MNEYVLTDNRSWLARWWQRRTINPFLYDGSLIASARVRLSVLDRLLVLCGRTVEVDVRTTAGDDAAMAACRGLTVECRTIPRRWR